MKATPRPTCPADVRIEDHVPLALLIITRGKYGRIARSAGIRIEDLIQEAAIGMMRARTTWDPALGAWSTYAGLWIKQACQRFIANHGATVRVPCHVQAERRKARQRPRAEVYSLDRPLCDG
ncbi:MAG TPA: sigma factor, partial [Polyangiaceae bacterium]|nr:sigma factor [Polyangiaceae bacterium]